MAARPKTLAAAVVPVLVGTALAIADRAFAPAAAAAAMLGAIAIQIGTNLANDYFDAKHGADEERVGPVRVTQTGLVTPAQIQIAIALSFGFAALCGLYLALVAGWPVVIIGLASIASGLAYTAGPYPLGYHGLGDLFVFIFFGLVAVVGTYYVQALRISALAMLLAVPVGLMTTAILVVNNLRDAETDRRSGKQTLAARFGRRFGRVEYFLLLLFSYAVPAALVATRMLPAWGLMPLISIPLAVSLLRTVFSDASPADYNRALAGTSRLLLAFGLLLSLGVIL